MSSIAAANWQEARNLRLAARLGEANPQPPSLALAREGVLRRAVGLTLEASGCSAPLGSRCKVETSGGRWVDTEVVGFAGDRTYLMPTADLEGLLPNARVVPTRRRGEVAVGEGLLGRVIDSDGVPLDGRGAIRPEGWMGLAGTAINPLMREPISQSLDVGVRAINALLPIGRGQRIGLFAGSGVGKSTLLGMMTRYTAADVIVVGLIGERGREVRDFVESTLGVEGLRRSVVVATPADRPPLARLHGALRATAIAEWFRDQGLHVLLLMDSLTRFAHAQREIGLSVGEPPTTRGYPPSVFAKLPQLVERAGNGADGRGSITAFYTVLTEGDDQQEPIADAAQADPAFRSDRAAAVQRHAVAVDDPPEQAFADGDFAALAGVDHPRVGQQAGEVGGRHQEAAVAGEADHFGVDPVAAGGLHPAARAQRCAATGRFQGQADRAPQHAFAGEPERRRLRVG